MVLIGYLLLNADVLVDLLDLPSVDKHIILVDMHVTDYFSLPQANLNSTGLLVSWLSWSTSCSLEVELSVRIILTKKSRISIRSAF